MLYISRLRALWSRLPSLQVPASESVLLHFYSDYSGSTGSRCRLQKLFSGDPAVEKLIVDNNINCYTQDVCHAQPELIDRLEITTVPVVVGIYRGRKVGEVRSDSATSCGSDLCKKLVEAASSASSASQVSDDKELEAQINALVKGKTREQALSALAEFEKSHIQRLEIDSTLRQLLARTRLQLYHPNFDGYSTNAVQLSIEALRDHLRSIEQLISDLDKASVEELIASFPSDGHVYAQADWGKKTSMAVGNRHIESNVASTIFHKDGHYTNNYRSASGSLADKRLEDFVTEYCYSDIANRGMFQGAILARLIKVEVLKRISIVMFLHGDVDVAMEEAVRAYEELVKLLKSDSIPVQLFQSHEIGSVIECMLSALPWRHPAVLGARAALETMDGPRLLNRMRQSNRPLGGPVSKRRGFGGRYVWQGPDYRPKKYRPRDPEQYLNEWRYEADSNLPTF
ncbi:tRNA pseudouridine synthase D, putative [Babesia ovata]|uniref:tRNA pseudouridine synthase D, putative n=1 Tax=Babesia ovata TaxID=189622 RepID=A0A2H6KCD7_9APIC|nr:tRNA pseudouridine synthase D, putative [Babesia ovata]GBE60647.1 tRNA pseudouridine synthase D, putative [Babesia ovata]